MESSSGNGSPASFVIKPTRFEVQACQFSSWYSTFRNMQLSSDSRKYRKNVTIESVIIRPLPSEFINYLKSDGVRLPDCATKVSSSMNDVDADDEWAAEDSGDECDSFSFQTLTDEIQLAINSFGGEGKKGCMPKLNWSSPKDATWINCGSLKCTKVGDVYLLLKSSEFITFDLENAWIDVDNDVDESIELNPILDDEQKFELVLRKWCNLHPSMEFRCFVYEHELIAVSQRHPSKYYTHLQHSGEGENPILMIIQKFFHTYVQKKIAAGRLHRYVLDLYVDSQERSWIIDFNVWGSRTDGLLFDWEELSTLGSNVNVIARDEVPVKPAMRVITKDMKSMTYDPLSSFRGPTDVMDLLGQGDSEGNGFEGNPSFVNFMQQCVRPSEL